MFENHYGEFLPIMKHAVQCHFNKAGPQESRLND